MFWEGLLTLWHAFAYVRTDPDLAVIAAVMRATDKVLGSIPLKNGVVKRYLSLRPGKIGRAVLRQLWRSCERSTVSLCPACSNTC